MNLERAGAVFRFLAVTALLVSAALAVMDFLDIHNDLSVPIMIFVIGVVVLASRFADFRNEGMLMMFIILGLIIIAAVVRFVFVSLYW